MNDMCFAKLILKSPPDKNCYIMQKLTQKKVGEIALKTWIFNNFEIANNTCNEQRENTTKNLILDQDKKKY